MSYLFLIAAVHLCHLLYELFLILFHSFSFISCLSALSVLDYAKVGPPNLLLHRAQKFLKPALLLFIVWRSLCGNFSTHFICIVIICAFCFLVFSFYISIEAFKISFCYLFHVVNQFEPVQTSCKTFYDPQIAEPKQNWNVRLLSRPNLSQTFI